MQKSKRKRDRINSKVLKSPNRSSYDKSPQDQYTTNHFRQHYPQKPKNSNLGIRYSQSKYSENRSNQQINQDQKSQMPQNQSKDKKNESVVQSIPLRKN